MRKPHGPRRCRHGTARGERRVHARTEPGSLSVHQAGSSPTSRRAKAGHSVFNQEPDIKNGVGGLRDYQNAVWMARVKLGIASITELAPQNYVRADDLAQFRRAYDFLLRVRNDLHFQSTRPTDTMTLEAQPKIAQNLGYADPDAHASGARRPARWRGFRPACCRS